MLLGQTGIPATLILFICGICVLVRFVMMSGRRRGNFLRLLADRFCLCLRRKLRLRELRRWGITLCRFSFRMDTRLEFIALSICGRFVLASGVRLSFGMGLRML